MQHHTTATATTTSTAPQSHPPSSSHPNTSTSSLPFPPLPSFSLASITSSQYAHTHTPTHPPTHTHTHTPTATATTTTSSPSTYDTNTNTMTSSLSQRSSPSVAPLPPSYIDLQHGSSVATSTYNDPRFSTSSSAYAADMYTLGDHQGFIRILPRTSAASALYKKRCETCATTHDGSFGAGRFCSSRCARTVGGLAHRKKRMMERDAKQRSAAEHRAKIKKRRHPFDRETSLCEEALVQLTHDARDIASCSDSARSSPRTVITINSLLNPAES